MPMPIIILGGAIAGIPLIILLAFISEHGALRLFIRFAVGQHLDGKMRTNATHIRRGRRVTHYSGHASKWATRSHMERAAIRWAIVFIISMIIYGLMMAMTLTVIAVTVTFIVVMALSMKRIGRKWENRHLGRQTVTPMAAAVSTHWQISPQVARESISMRRDYASVKGMERIGTIVIPDHVTATEGEKELFETLIRNRLGVELTFRWHTTRHPMTLDIERAPIAPTLVPFSDVLPVIKSLPEDKVLIGITGKGERKHWDLSSEEPHCLVSANSRRGKTRLLLLIAGQVLFQGGSVTAIDPKRVGIDEALAGVPDTIVESDPREIERFWDAIKRYRTEMDARIDAYQADRTVTFKRKLLVIDEVSQFAAQSKMHWQKVKSKGDPALPPVWDDISAVVWQGAQFKCNALVFGQRIEHSTMGGIIDGFGCRLLAGYQRRTFDRLIGTTPYMPSQKPRGRFLYWDGDNPVFIQTVLGNDQEIRNLAMEGKRDRKPVIQGKVIEHA